MLSRQIIETIKYFDVQDHPLTLVEISKYLLADNADAAGAQPPREYSLDEIAAVLDRMLASAQTPDRLPEIIEERQGFYCLPGRSEIIDARLKNNLYATPRLKRVRKYLPFVRHLPFISGAALTGSEALNNSKKGSDIDLLVITEKNRMWLGRLVISAYFQLLGMRRHGKLIENRFCLNHYIERDKTLNDDTNLYTAVEYVSLMAFSGGDVIFDFQQKNLPWIRELLAQPQIVRAQTLAPSASKRFFERLFANSFGDILERVAGRIQLRRIKISEYIIVATDEVSFHPNSKGQQVLAKLKAEARSNP